MHDINVKQQSTQRTLLYWVIGIFALVVLVAVIGVIVAPSLLNLYESSEGFQAALRLLGLN